MSRRLACLASVATLALSPLLGAPTASWSAPVPGAPDWPMFHRDAEHTGASPETTLTASNASSLGLEWQTNTGQGTNNSPAIVYNAQLDKTVLYTASKNHVVSAYDATNGNRLWYFQAGSSVSSSPAVVNGVVYIGSDDHNLYALDATTGAKLCSFDTGGVINASPLVVDAGAGRVVYVGDNGIGGASDGGHVWAINAVDPNAATDCSLKWSYDQFGEPPGSQPDAGSWSPPSFATTATGRKLVVVGSSSPDCAVYAFDALTGAKVWRFETRHTSFDADVGAGTTISPPGVNGFADGVVYAIGKSHVFYALNLRTGEKIWEYDINVDSPNFVGSTRSTPALVGSQLFVGYGEGAYSLDAITGAKLWKFNTDTLQEVISSPAVSGPAGNRVVFFSDLAGKVYAVNAATGARLWKYDTGGYSYSSPAIWNGNVYIGSSDGFVYSFGLGGGVSGKPTATITSPPDGTTITNPSGNITITGTATDDVGVTQVLVAVKQHTGNDWWDAGTSTYQDVFSSAPATLSNPGGTSTNWSFTVPISSSGGSYTIQAEAVDRDGQHTTPVAVSRISVSSAGNPPDTTVDTPVKKEIFALPNPPAPIAITIEGFATDDAGANPGVKSIRLLIKNIEHSEYYCGFQGCGGSTSYFTTKSTRITVTPSSPRATETSWTYTFYTMDHPHNYRIQAQAIDNDNEKDPSKASVSPICVRLAGQSCAGTVG